MFLHWSRHRFYKTHVFIEAAPLTILWYIRNAIAVLATSLILTIFVWSFGLDGFDAKAIIASMALLVSLLAFVVNYAAAVRPSTLLRVRYSSLFASSFGFTREDQEVSVVDQRPHGLNGITIFNWSKNDIEIASVDAEVRNATISISHQAPSETRTQMPISIPSGNSATIRYDYPNLAWTLGCTDSPSRPWLVLTASDGRQHRFPLPPIVQEDMLTLRKSRPEPIGYPIAYAYHRYHLYGSFEDHTKQIISYLGLTTPVYATRHAVDPSLDYSFRIRVNGQWGPSYTFPNMQDCIDTLIDIRSLESEPEYYVIFQTKDSEQLILAIGTEDQFTFATMSQNLSLHNRLLGGSIDDVLEAMPDIRDLATICLKHPTMPSL